jgi:hypothetical protein
MQFCILLSFMIYSVALMIKILCTAFQRYQIRSGKYKIRRGYAERSSMVTFDFPACFSTNSLGVRLNCCIKHFEK